MKLAIPFLIASTVCGHTAAWAQSARSGGGKSQSPTALNIGAPVVYVGLFSVRQGGGSGHAALTSERAGDAISGTLSISPCGGGAAGDSKYGVSVFASDIWRITGKVLEMNDQEAVIQMDVLRVRRNGQDETASPESMTMTLKRGERKTIETLTFPAAGSCEPSTSAFGAMLATRPEMSGVSPASYARGSVASPPGTVVVGRMYKDGQPVPTTPVFHDADLWLVRTTPGRPDETLHIATTVMPLPKPFEFAPITIQSSSGTLSVKVEGTIESGRATDGEPRLHFTARRAVTALTTSRPVGQSTAAVEGSTKTTIAVPGPLEVLSFEMPPLRTADGVTLPDRLSIRLRVTPK